VLPELSIIVCFSSLALGCLVTGLIGILHERNQPPDDEPDQEAQCHPHMT